MKKAQKIKELLDRLDVLEGKEVLPSEMDKITDTYIKEEVSNMQAKLKDNPTIKILQKFGTELEKFKKDFDLKPLSDALIDIENEIKESQQEMLQEFQSRIQEVRSAIPKIPKMPDPFDDSKLVKDITNLRELFLSKQDFDSRPLEKELKTLKDQLKSIVVEMNDTSRDDEQKKDTETKIEKIRQEFLQKLSTIKIGGGSMNRKITVDGTDYLTRYTDINFVSGTDITLSAANDNAKKRVNITITSGDLTTYVPYTGATTAVNLGAQNLTTTGTIGSGVHTITKNNLLTTFVDGLLLTNTTAADVTNTVQNSPALYFKGSAWKSSATAASQTHEWEFLVVPVTGTSSTSSTYTIRNSNNGGAYSNVLTLTSTGIISCPVYSATNSMTVLVTGTDTTFSTANFIRCIANTAAASGTKVRHAPPFSVQSEYYNGSASVTDKWWWGAFLPDATPLTEAFSTYTFRHQNASGTNYQVAYIGSRDTSASGIRDMNYFNPEVAQSSTAGANAFVIDLKQTSTGSGVYNLLDLRAATVSKCRVTNNGELITLGGRTKAYLGITSLATLDATHHVVDCTANTFTVTLPTAASIAGREYTIKNSGTGVITIACNGAETIDGATTQTLGQYDSITVVSNNTNWIII